MKLFTTKQIAGIDKYTIENEPIKSIDLMERAADNLLLHIDFDDYFSNKFIFICGHGNNGGDGLAIARKMFLDERRVDIIKVYLFAKKEMLSKDCAKNWKRLKKIKHIEKHLTFDPDEIQIDSDSIVIDALFGSGLSRPLDEPYKTLIKKINHSGAKIISIDIPSGLMGEDNRNNNSEAIIQSDIILTLEFPKLSFFFPENEPYVKNFEIVPIGLSEKAKQEIDSPYFYIDDEFAKSLLKKRRKFAEKRDFGHALLIAGSFEKPGSAILVSKACLRSGAGLAHVHIPKNCATSIIANFPDVMLSLDENDLYITNVPLQPYYTAIAIGSGIGTKTETVQAFKEVLVKVKEKNLPLVIDADGLNILSQNKEWLYDLPQNTILTPHSREFDRLFGNHETHFERFLTARQMSKKYGIIIVLKGAHSQVHTPNGNVYFNSSGTPYMATAGSGDVLTGIITGLLAQHYTAEHAAILAVYYHGLAGQYAQGFNYKQIITASDIVNSINFD